jgi:hypothetical protein
MNRLRDYIGFIIRFLGLGYLALWPLASNGGAGGKLFGASILCRTGVLDVLCHSPHPLAMPPALHAMGVLSVLAVAGQFIWRLLRRARHRAAARTPIIPAPGVDNSLRKPTPRPRCRPVQPRDHFGLRGQRPAIGNQSCNGRIV